MSDAGRKRFDHKTNWIRSLVKSGKAPSIKVVKLGITRSRAEFIERFMIRLLQKPFQLVNSHEGGSVGYAGLNEESRMKHRRSVIENVNPVKISEGVKKAWLKNGRLRVAHENKPIPEETKHRRALYDARGDFSGRHTFPAPNGLQDVWETRRAVSGRTDQHEVYVEGVLCATIGAKLLGLLIAERYRRGPMSAQDVQNWVAKMRPNLFPK